MQPCAPHPQGRPSELGSGAESTPEQGATADDRPAHTGADREHGHVADGTPGPEAVLRPAGSIGVVVDGDVEWEARAQVVAQRLIAPADIRRVVDGGLIDVDESGCGNSRRLDLAPLRERLDHRYDGIDDGRGIACLGRYPLLREDRAILRDHRSGDLGSPDINPNGIHGDRVYRRRDSVVSLSLPG